MSDELPPEAILSGRSRLEAPYAHCPRLSRVFDLFDIEALIRHAIDLLEMPAAGAVVYGRSFNALITFEARQLLIKPSVVTRVSRQARPIALFEIE